MRIAASRTRPFRALAAAIGPDELMALARTIPSVETDELVRLLRSASPPGGADVRAAARAAGTGRDE